MSRYIHRSWSLVQRPLYIVLCTLVIVLVTWSCSSSNCPLESKVTCNYAFYDSEGNAVTYADPITVTTLLPGTKTVYVYRKLGYITETLDHRDESLIEDGYTESVSEVRRDTVLINRLSSAALLKVPMSYYNATDTLVFAYESLSARDTIYIHHDSYPYVELPECGTHRFHRLKDIRCSNTAAIDHVEIVNKTVNYEGKENVKIYFNGVAE